MTADNDAAASTYGRSEWDLAEEIVRRSDAAPGTKAHRIYDPEKVRLAREVLRLRDLAEVRYELLRAEKGWDVRAELTGRIDKLYMALNAEGRGDEADFDGTPLEDGKLKWNRLVELAMTSMAHWLASARWAALEHRAADELRASLAMVDEGAPVGRDSQ